MTANMYRVGDYVYFETSSTTPYQIRRIEELCKTSSGSVEAKVMCFYRRRDISSSLILLADKHQNSLGEDHEENILLMKEELSEKQQHQIKHRELFLSRQVETLPATHIRGKCSVTLLNQTESLLSYLNSDDSFFYSLVYDPQQKTLLADKGEIHVGTRYQVEPQAMLKPDESDGRDLADLEELVWDPSKSLDDEAVDSYLIIARSVGAFARALDCTSTVRQPSMHVSAAAASRDITQFHALEVLHKHHYNLSKAISSLVPCTGPVLCRDQIEEWSASEANLFEEALDKYGKEFADIRQDYLPWKTLRSIVEYYYMWKTTDRYVQQKRIKAAEAESKLKQVYIPSYNKPNPAQIIEKLNATDSSIISHSCESCYSTQSKHWFSWGPIQMQCRLCATCWTYWKKFGGLKMPTRLDGGTSADRSTNVNVSSAHKCSVSGCVKEFRVKSQLVKHLAVSHGLVAEPGSPSLVVKTRAAFCLVTTPLTRASRQVLRNLLKLSRAARQPFVPINTSLVKHECQLRLPELTKGSHFIGKARRRVPMIDVSARLGVDLATERPVLLQTHSKCAFPSLPVSPRVTPPPAKSELNNSGHVTPAATGKKRAHQHFNGSADGSPASKYQTTEIVPGGNILHSEQPDRMKSRSSSINRVNGDIHVGRSRKNIVIVTDTPDDVYFMANMAARKLRKKMIGGYYLKRFGRKPFSRGPVTNGSRAGVKSLSISSTITLKHPESVARTD